MKKHFLLFIMLLDLNLYIYIPDDKLSPLKITL